CPKLGLWYPRDSPFDLEAFSDSYYAGAHGDKKSITGGCQFLRRSGIQSTWSIRLFERGFYCLRPILLVGMVSSGGHSFLLVAVVSIHFCWSCSASEVSLPDGEKWLVATINGTIYTVIKASIRSALQLDDLNAIDTLTNKEIFARIKDIGYATEGKFTFFKNKFSPQWKFLIHTLIHCLSPKSGFWNQIASNIAIALIYLSTGRKYNFSNMIFNEEPTFIQAQQQEVSTPPPSLVVAPHSSFDPMPSPPRQSSPLLIPFVLETITSPIRDDDTGGGSFHESSPSPPSATPTRSLTIGVAKEPLPLNSLLALFPTCLQRIATLEAELKATKILHMDTMVLFAKRIKKSESKLKTKKRKLVLTLHEPSHSTTPSKLVNPEQSSEQEISPTTLDVVLTLSQSKARARVAMIIYKRLKKQQSSSELDFTDAAIFAGGLDSAGGVVSASGTDSTSGLTSASISVAVGPSVSAEPSSPIRDPAKGKAIATHSSPVTDPTNKELADQLAAILKAERQELLEQELKQSLDAEQVYLDSLLAQRENPTLSAELLGADVSEDTFSVRMVDLMNKQRKAITEMKAKAKREKPMIPAQQKEFMRTFVKNQSSAIYTTGWTLLGIKYDVGAEADFNNLETSIIVNPIPTIRVHKDHLVTQIIGDLSSAT
nr:ribonuclease H-like domain, reverse transcriptase, RNA-dependent DNA polymerase [Tanacetum cinerariifolium]